MGCGSWFSKRSAHRNSRTPEDPQADQVVQNYCLITVLPSPALERPEEAGLQLALGLMPVPHGAANWWGRVPGWPPVSSLGRLQLWEGPRFLPTSPERQEEEEVWLPWGPKLKGLWIES